MIDDWWEVLLAQRMADGMTGANEGNFDPPYPGSDDPQEQDENRAYWRGFMKRRKELGSEFRWR